MNIRHLLVIFLSITAGVCFGVAVSTHLLVTGSLNKTYRAYVVQSGSMEPALPIGSIVITQSSHNYNIGDIITFSPSENTSVTHRIVDKTDTSFSTKGDANEDIDNVAITQDQIIGKSILIVPKLGYLADFVRTPKGFVILVVIPAAIIIYEELKSVFKELKSFLKKDKNSGTVTKKAVLFIPLFGVMFMLFSNTGSFFSDSELVENNYLQVPTPTAEPIPDISESEL